MVKDEFGKKMSKNFGNGIDPTDVINEYGCDALRMSIVSNVTMGQDCRYSLKKAQNYAHFINKLYNAAKFVSLYLPDNNKTIKELNLTIFDKWILKELNDTIAYVDRRFDKTDISGYCNKMYEFVWNKFCDNYIEIAKIQINNGNTDSKNVLLYVLKSILIMLHPIIPFVTEQIYLQLPHTKTSIMTETFPTVLRNLKLNQPHANAGQIIDAIRQIRNIRAENKISDKQKIDLVINDAQEYFKTQTAIFEKLCNAKVQFNLDKNILQKHIFHQTSYAKLYILAEEILSDEEKIKKLNEQLAKVNAEILRSQNLLNNHNFVSKAPSELVEKEKEKLNKQLELKKFITENIANLTR